MAINLIEEVKRLGHECDYMPIPGSLIYQGSEYFRAKKLGLPVIGLRVTDLSGETVGWITEEDPYSISWT